MAEARSPIQTQVRSPVLVGREREVAALGDLLSATRSGRGSVVVVSGEAGIGKSRLVAEVVDRARAAELAVLRGRAVSERQAAFRPLADALAGAMHERRIVQAPDVVPFLGVLGRVMLPSASTAASTPRSSAATGEVDVTQPGLSASAIVAEGVLRLLRNIGEGRGVLLVLEDVHWADVETLEVVGHIADEAGNEPILVVMTQRTEDPGPVGDMVAELVARRAARRLPIERLEPDKVAELARQALGAEAVPAALLDALHSRAEGVPFLIEEMVSAFVSMGAALDAGLDRAASSRIAEGISPSYRAIVSARLARLDPWARRMVETAALIGRQFDWRLIGAAHGVDDARVLAGLRGAVEQQLIGETPGSHRTGFSFRHALAREAVLAEMLGPDRAALALAVAEAIENLFPGLPGDWCERAATLRDEAGDRLGTVRLLHESATRALGRGAFASAEAALVRAHDLAEGDPMAWAGIDELLAQVYSRSGRTDRLVDLVERVVGIYDHYRSLGGRLARPARLAQLHLLVARSGLATGDVALVRARLAAVADLVEGAEPEAVEAEIIGARLAVQEATTESARALTEALPSIAAAASRTGRPQLETEALAVRASASLRAGAVSAARDHLEELAAVAGRAGLPNQKVEALLELGVLDVATGGSPDRILEARQMALEIGAMAQLVRCDLELGRALLDGGQLDQAAEALMRASELAPRVAPPRMADVLLAQAALDGIAGRAAEMERQIELAVGAARTRDLDHVLASAFGDVRATAAMFRFDRSAAIVAFDKALDIDAGRSGISAARWAAMRHLLTLDKRSSTSTDDALARALEAYATACILGRDGQSDQAVASFELAGTLMPAGCRRELARVIVAEGAIKDHWGTPGEWASHAEQFFAAVGLQPAAAFARNVMRRAGVPVRRRGRGDAEVPPDLRAVGVTSREMDVLLMVGLGLSNRAIGERLFVSGRTVETHVASLIRKTGLQSRSELVALGARRRGDAEPGSNGPSG